MSDPTTPEPWFTAMEQRGISSIRDLSRKSGVAVETVRRLVQGSRKAPRDETLRAVAGALGLPLATISAWAGAVTSDTEEPYSPPAEANRLTLRQREAVDELIRLLAQKEAGGEHEQRSAPSKQAGGSPAVEVPVRDSDTQAPQNVHPLTRERRMPDPETMAARRGVLETEAPDFTM